PFLNEFSGLIELEKLRRLCAARRTRISAASVDEQMFLRIESNAFRFADRMAFRHQRERDGIEWKLRDARFEFVLRLCRGLLLRAWPASTASTGWRLARRSAAARLRWASTTLGIRHDTQ